MAAIINYFCKYSRGTNMLCTKASFCFWRPKDYCNFDFALLISGFQLIIPLLPWQLVDTGHRPPPRPDPPETRLSAKNVTEMGVIRAADLCLCLLNRTSTRFCVFWHVHGRQKCGKGNKLKAIWNVWLKLSEMKMFSIVISLAVFLQFTRLHVLRTPGVSFDRCWLRHRNFPQHLRQQRAASRGDTAACPVVTPKVS